MGLQAVPNIECRDFVPLGKRGVIETVLDEVVDRSTQIEHRLAYVDKLARAFAHDVDSEQFSRGAIADHFKDTIVHSHDVTTRGLAEASDAAFIAEAPFSRVFLR